VAKTLSYLRHQQDKRR
jgi:hypothetical protein